MRHCVDQLCGKDSITHHHGLDELRGTHTRKLWDTTKVGLSAALSSFIINDDDDDDVGMSLFAQRT